MCLVARWSHRPIQHAVFVLCSEAEHYTISIVFNLSVAFGRGNRTYGCRQDDSPVRRHDSSFGTPECLFLGINTAYRAQAPS